IVCVAFGLLLAVKVGSDEGHLDSRNRASIVTPAHTNALLGVAPALASDRSQASSEEIPCNTTVGWTLVASSGTSRDHLSVHRESSNQSSLQWSIERDKKSFTALLRAAQIANLSSIKLDVWSQVDTFILVHVEDVDHAKFNCPVKLEAGKWKHLQATPHDFKLADDSPVKKTSLDPARLAVGFCLVDAGGILGNPTPNTLRFCNAHIERKKIEKVKIPRIIDSGVFTLKDSGQIPGDIVVRKGATLRITAPKVGLAGNIVLDGGRLEVRNSVLTIIGRFPHDRTIAAIRSTISITDSVIVVNNMVNLNLDKSSQVEMKRTEFTGGGFTVGAGPDCSLTLEKVKRPGEFVILPGAHIHVRDCDELLFWPWFNATNKATVVFPDGKSVASWKMPDEVKIDLSITNSRGMLWGLVLDTGADASIKDSKVRALGVSFTSQEPQSLSNIKNKAPTANLKLNLGDRRLQLANTTVETWNVYPRELSHVTIRDCLCGEVMSFDTAESVMEDSICDGTGGYVASKGKSKLHLIRCRLECPATAVEDSSLILEKCTVNGAVSASGNATLTLIDTQVKGAVTQIGKGKIIRK
ncbi:MAG: hypothetical protein K2Z81_15385, partial [Cyanobacteria bacterium]|nr:hypothetical protein [Cyanobacteriota bacterium]